MTKSKIIFLTFIFSAATIFSPIAALANHSISHTLQELQSQLASLQAAVNALLAEAATPAQPSPGTGTQAQPAIPAKKAATTTATSTQSATPAQPATPATPAQPATPYSGIGTSTVPAQPATPATPAVPAQPAGPALFPEAAAKRQETIKQIQNTLQSIQLKLNDLKSKTQTAQQEERKAVFPEIKLTRSLQRGLSGEDVKQLQGFLKRFPDIYPEGLTTGYFGSKTEEAVKRFQEKFGIETLGIVGPKTHEKIGELSYLINKKQQPKITVISPDSGSIGSMVTIGGSGFTENNNSIFVRGKIVLSDIRSFDGRTLEFSLPEGTPCLFTAANNNNSKGNACPIKVVNANGVSNAKPFMVTGAFIVPPSIPPEPTETDILPPFRSNGLPSGSLPAGTTQTTLSLITDENATCRYATAAGITYSSMVSAFLTSGGTSHSKAITGLENGKSYSYYVRCIDGAGNANTDDFVISFGIATPPPPPKLISLSPAILIKGEPVTLNGTGFTAANNTVTFTGSFDKPNQVVSGVVSLDGATLLVTVPQTMPCNVVSECSVFVSNQNGTSNRITFWFGQKVDPVTVLMPNGGETILQGTGITLSASGGTSEAFYGNVSVSYALVDAEATTVSDPSGFILGWIVHMSLNTSVYKWDAIRLCNWDNANAALPEPGSCWKAQPGNYKILAVGRNELNQPTIWDLTSDKPGNIDVSDASFTILPAPSITVVSPNGGEKFAQGNQVTISWEASSIMNKSVNIKLLKSGTPYLTIGSNIPMSAPSGLYTYLWTIPASIVGNNYTIEVSDASNAALRDVSDAPFSVVLTPAVTVLAPNGGEYWMPGFKGMAKWSSANIESKAVNINLLKSGVLERVIATNIPQTYSWSATGTTYTGGTFWYSFVIPSDVPFGSDYTVEVTDSSNAATRDVSDASLNLVQFPSSVTVSGRLINRFNQTPITGVDLYAYGRVVVKSGTNGEFNVSALTPGVSQLIAQAAPGCRQYPQGYLWWNSWVNAYQQSASAAYFSSHIMGVKYSSYPYIQSEQALGDLGLWPAGDLATNSDVPVSFAVNYGDVSYWLSPTLDVHSTAMRGTMMALDRDIQVVGYDRSTSPWTPKYYPPVIRLSLENGCAPKTLTLSEGNVKWEPYSIIITLVYPSAAKVGTAYKLTLSANGGIAPYTWRLLYGALPPGLSLDFSTGIISGIPTTLGTYQFSVRTIDSNGVSSGSNITIYVQ